MSIDALSIASHKIFGPKGTGLCYINPQVKWKGQVPNTSHEGGFRPGTVDVPSILAFTAAGQKAYKRLQQNKEKMTQLRHFFINKLKTTGLDFTLYESKHNQLPQIVGLSFAKLQGQYIMLECNKYEVAISTGSACQVGQQSPSRTLLSLGKTKDEANQLVRISFANPTTEAEINRLIEVLEKIVT